MLHFRHSVNRVVESGCASSGPVHGLEIRKTFTRRKSHDVLPDTYVLEQTPGQGVIALASEHDPVSAALRDNTGCVELSDVGRAAVFRFALSTGNGILRQYRRGGLLGPVFGDRFLGNRMRHEFEVSLAWYQLGGPIPEPLGVAWRKTGMMYRGAYAARQVDGVTLLRYLQEDIPLADTVLESVGSTIRQLHDAGFWHADLQVKNIMISEGKPFLIDFDKARRVTLLGPVLRSRNLLRLRRSFEKQGLSLDNFATLLKGYGNLAIPGWLACLYRLRGMSAGLRGAS